MKPETAGLTRGMPLTECIFANSPQWIFRASLAAVFGHRVIVERMQPA